MNIKLQIDDLLILDWDSKDDEYKLDLNYLYVSPNFISIKKIKFLFSGSGRSIIFFILALITYISPYVLPVLILYYILIIYFNVQFLNTNSYSDFIFRSIFKLICFYLIFLSGWIYMNSIYNF